MLIQEEEVHSWLQEREKGESTRISIILTDQYTIVRVPSVTSQIWTYLHTYIGTYIYVYLSSYSVGMHNVHILGTLLEHECTSLYISYRYLIESNMPPELCLGRPVCLGKNCLSVFVVKYKNKRLHLYEK